MGLLLIQVSQRQSSVVILLPGWGLIVVESTVGGRQAGPRRDMIPRNQL
jgi:hypothetical protein